MLDQLLGLFLIGIGVKTPYVPGNVLGDETEQTETIKEEKEQIKKETQQLIQEKKAAVQNRKEEKKEAIEERKEDIKNLKIAREDEWNRKKEAFKEQVKTKREEAKEQFKEAREAFKERLETIKDEKKKEIVENVDEKMAAVNKNRTDNMTSHLSRMEEIISRLSTGITELTSQGVSTTEIQSLLSAAEVSFSTAKSAVSTQAGKEYIIGVTTEDRLGESVSRVRTQLESDLRSTQESVKRAREAIALAIQEMARIRKANPASSTGSTGL